MGANNASAVNRFRAIASSHFQARGEWFFPANNNREELP
mgnify:CR=1 FL=1